MATPKTDLTPEDKIAAAYLHFMRGWPYQDLQIAFGGVNVARIHDACMEVYTAANNGKKPPRRRRGKDEAELPLEGATVTVPTPETVARTNSEAA